MPATWRPVHLAVPQATKDAFVDLICSDEQLLRAAFDEIIAAEWPAPPSARRRPHQGDLPAGGEGRPGLVARRRPVRSRRAGNDAGRRQRSPP